MTTMAQLLLVVGFRCGYFYRSARPDPGQKGLASDLALRRSDFCSLRSN